MALPALVHAQAGGCDTVRHVRAVNVVNYSLDLTWDSLGAPLYEVAYGPAGFEPDSMGNSLITDTFALHLAGLEAYQRYDFLVRAHCDEGESGPWSERLTVVAFERCDQPDTLGVETHSVDTNALANTAFRYSLMQFILDSADLADLSAVTAFAFYVAQADGADRMGNCQVYLGHTPKSTFSNANDWIAVDNTHQLVFSGDLAVVEGWNEFAIEVPFVWNRYSNIVVTIDRNTGSFGGTNRYGALTGCGNKCHFTANDMVNPDPANMANYNRVSNVGAFCPMFRLLSCPSAPCRAPELEAEVMDQSNAMVRWYGNGSQYEYDCHPVDQERWIGGGISANSLTLCNLQPATTYLFRLRMVCGEGEYSDWSSLLFTTDSIPCFTPDAPEVGEVGRDGVSLTWSPAADEHLWQVRLVRLADTLIGDTLVFDTLVTTFMPQLSLGRLMPGRYEAFVRSMCAQGAAFSAWSAATPFETLPCEPVGDVVATYSPFERIATVEWEPNGPALRWLVSYGPAGHTFGQDTVVEVLGQPRLTVGGVRGQMDFIVRTFCADFWFGEEVRSNPVGFGPSIPLGIDQAEAPALSLWPNPASDCVRIQNPEFRTHNSLQLIDLQGRVVREEMFDSEFLIMNLQGLPKGAYFVKAGTAVGKLIVQ